MSMFSTTTPQQRKVQEVTVQKRSYRLFIATFHSHSAFIITVICVCKGELFIFIFLQLDVALSNIQDISLEAAYSVGQQKELAILR